MDNLYTKLKKFGIVKTNVSMSKHTTFRVGGLARFLVTVSEVDKLIELLNFLSGEGIEYFVLGGGSNVLWKDDEYDGVVVKVTSLKFAVAGDKIIADAGVPLALVVNTATQNALTGMEWAAGIPGTIGGAVRGNAGAYGGDTAGNLEKVEVWQDGEVVEYTKEQAKFGYRDSLFKQNGAVILRAHFVLRPGDKTEILKKTQEYVQNRCGKFSPQPCAGSFFKNLLINQFPGDKSILPEKFLQVGKVGAAFLIEQCGLKGFAVGGAKVSEEHANFIVNCNNATQADVLQVVEKVREAVYNKFGVYLEPEVQIVKS